MRFSLAAQCLLLTGGAHAFVVPSKHQGKSTGRAPAFQLIKRTLSPIITPIKSTTIEENIEAVSDDSNKDDEDHADDVIAPVPGSFTIETTNTGPSDGKVHKMTLHLQPDQEPIIFENGKVGRQAAGAVVLSRGETVLFSTAARDDKPKEEIDFLPLSVEHQERFSSVGTTSGSYNRRDGRPAEHEILTCRLIDRPLRPLITSGWRHETQLLSWVLSYDGIRSCDPLAITASATALYISDVPLCKPVAAVMVGFVDGEYVVNPTNEQMEKSRLNLTIAGTQDAVLMIEGAADFLTEAEMVTAVKLGHDTIKTICEAIQAFGKVAGKEKIFDTIASPPEGLQDRVDALFSDRVDQMYAISGNKDQMGSVMSTLSKAVVTELDQEFPEQKVAIKTAFKDLLCRRMFIKAKETGLRCDGRQLTEIRRLDMEAGFLPRVHGSALFTRGETQAIATATLGDSAMKQRIERIDGNDMKRFYLQYTFPPSCVGETGRVGMPGRREVGHGNLAERALIPTLPDESEFPYTIRVESLITESNGSSSMASVCGGTLSLMDAGVPIKKPVAGIAMGMLLGDKGSVSDDNAVILSDILGTEDALGTMDFKVAGDRDGITTFQLDIKCEGLTLETMEKALQQAKEGRLHLLDEMDKVLSKPRPELPSTVPKIRLFSILPESIGKVIGPGGKQIRALIEDFGLSNMDVDDDGNIQISGFDTEVLEKTEAFVRELVSSDRGRGKSGGDRPKYEGPPAVVGKTYNGKITGIHNFGAFLEILPGAEDGSYPGLEGLCHVSELHTERVRNPEGFIRSMGVEEFKVRFLGINEKGRVQLSRKDVLLNPIDKIEEQPKEESAEEKAPKDGGMSDDEIDIIAKAIEGLSE